MHDVCDGLGLVPSLHPRMSLYGCPQRAGPPSWRLGRIRGHPAWIHSGSTQELERASNDEYPKTLAPKPPETLYPLILKSAGTLPHPLNGGIPAPPPRLLVLSDDAYPPQ